MLINVCFFLDLHHAKIKRLPQQSRQARLESLSQGDKPAEMKSKEVERNICRCKVKKLGEMSANAKYQSKAHIRSPCGKLQDT